jgi:hypothetical protein
VMGVVDVMDVHKGRKCWNILDCFMGLNMQKNWFLFRGDPNFRSTIFAVHVPHSPSTDLWRGLQCSGGRGRNGGSACALVALGKKPHTFHHADEICWVGLVPEHFGGNSYIWWVWISFDGQKW